MELHFICCNYANYRADIRLERGKSEWIVYDKVQKKTGHQIHVIAEKTISLMSLPFSTKNNLKIWSKSFQKPENGARAMSAKP